MPLPQLADILATLDLAQKDDTTFVATQIDNADHHIIGGHIAAQALMAASRTVVDRQPHSIHVYLLRAGDARYPVEMDVAGLRDGGSLSTRQVTARQGGDVLLEALVSFSVPMESIDYQQAIPDVPDPGALLPVEEQLRDYADELGGFWVRPQWVERRYIDAPPRLARDLPAAPEHTRMWWRPAEPVADDPILNSCLLTYITGTTMLETTVTQRRTTQLATFSALIDHAIWFHRPADLSDWVLSDQTSPSGIHGRGLATATMFNRSGQFVCTATQEIYFGRERRSS
ncbi:acyl-CoA thioesterase [Mycolicibacterium mageritense DSM 44476 = CIP 104973]|uniref:Acyl-CoA thioesterase 2 n=1 Tax=Mycolicibacterium mageritense TaxID=53462 RepID=A0AAI8U0T2_MYCME|nr:acyl-CoA thioesterase domain-containing protein [Mycolicibacterium mageritense]MCC9180482.1 thioesterase family protein [Mycolicibacterium mageritense]TXI57176.1 MAG: acyl-CoA thioesterase II [Mycolicibacterium mageritense]CDO25602.1 acyl-CoA thioesterase [Mycolicibacterium mageritense DSM 44476 = CIP 104973]BBX37731.1 acyl-CoA thioesterase II [Mycolicibacterium mageritense]BDY32431.1 Acyl-CoA thioesterase 2 [Mycolicibacterium mageritense]